jgi:hypothetical protein
MADTLVSPDTLSLGLCLFGFSWHDLWLPLFEAKRVAKEETTMS